MNPRQRRLEADHTAMMSRLAGSPFVDVMPLPPFPPERYRIVYRVPGLRLDAANRPVIVNQHIVDVVLPAAYPREKPYATTVEPVFHPNFGAYVCLADFWSPAQGLVDIVVQMADMLQYKRYNVRSPLNAVAAEWAVRNGDSLPLADINIVPGDVAIELGSATVTGDPA